MDDIYDEFVAELVRLADGLKPGDPLNLGAGEYTPPLYPRRGGNG